MQIETKPGAATHQVPNIDLTKGKPPKAWPFPTQQAKQIDDDPVILPAPEELLPENLIGDED